MMKSKIKLFILLIFSFPIIFNGQISYNRIKINTETKRLEFRKQFEANKSNPKQIKSIVSEAQVYLLQDINNYFKAWYGTKWSFHGHTSIPRNGEIACGYFITTTLLDMGFKIPRIKWAQMASEGMIKLMTTDIKRFHNTPMRKVAEYIESRGEGLYVVGLDCHVGYIYYCNKQMRFIHSNYYKPQIGVMSEKLIGKNPLNDSKYRIIGKIFDENMIKMWIKGSKF